MTEDLKVGDVVWAAREWCGGIEVDSATVVSGGKKIVKIKPGGSVAFDFRSAVKVDKVNRTRKDALVGLLHRLASEAGEFEDKAEAKRKLAETVAEMVKEER